MRYGPEKAHPYLFSQLRKMFLAMIFLLCLMMITRFIFIGLFTDVVLLKKNLSLTLKSLFLGLRYDLIPITYIAVIPFINLIIGFFVTRESYLKFIPIFNRLWFFIFTLLLGFILICDLGFYSFFQEHINVLFFGFWEDDTAAIFASIFKNYRMHLWIPLMLIGVFILFFSYIKIFKRERIDLFYASPLRKEFSFLLFTGLTLMFVFFARGSFSRLPLSIEDSHLSGIDDINELSVNGVIALNRAMRIRKEFGTETVHYLKKMGFERKEEALSVFHQYRDQSLGDMNGQDLFTSLKQQNISSSSSKPHVIFIVMESFGSSWWDYDEKGLPFLDEFKQHAKEDYLFLNFLSSENGTIGSLTSLASGLPQRPGSRFLSEGEFMKVPLQSALQKPYEQAGYETRYLYGGKLGWRQLGAYLDTQGFHVLEGADQIKEKMNLEGSVPPKELGNEWGIFDEYLFSYLKDQLEKAPKPQFFFVLSTSNHPPFETPSSFQKNGLDKIPDDLKHLFAAPESDVLLRFKTTQYANRQLGKFLTDLKKSPLKDQVVVAVTGDHSFWIGKDLGKGALPQKYGVPFYLYLPEGLRKEIDLQKEMLTQKWASHIDIMPTLYGRTLPGDFSYWGMGVDLFQNKRSVGINSYPMIVNEKGAIIDGKSYCWKEYYKKLLEECPLTSDHQELNNYYRAQIGLTDEFLKAHQRASSP